MGFNNNLDGIAPNCPCTKNCKDRTVACHSYCKAYKEWQLVQNSTVNPPTGNLRGGLSNFKAFSAGRFKPVIKNVYNGSVYTKELPSVWVDAY